MTSRPATPVELETARRSLEVGGVVLCATDTVYGLAVRAGLPEASAAVFALKGRVSTRPLPVMVGSVADLEALGVEVTPAAGRLLSSAFVPGPLTLALGFRTGDGRPDWLAGRDEVAVRIPADSAMRELVVACGPLLVTSANVSDQPTPSSAEEILATLHGHPDVAIDTGPCPEVPSTLVNCHVRPPVVEREGLVSARKVMEVLA